MAIPDSPKSTMIHSLDTSLTKKGLRQKVAFCSSVIQYGTISRHNMSAEERMNYWYQDCEYDGIRQEIVETIQRSLKCCGDDEDDDTFCMRGLEHSYGRPLRACLKLRTTSIYKVLDEQDYQVQEDIYDDDAIAKAYSRISRKCRFQAEVRAMLDHSDIEDYIAVRDGENGAQEQESDDTKFEDYLLQGIDGLLRNRTRQVYLPKCTRT